VCWPSVCSTGQPESHFRPESIINSIPLQHPLEWSLILVLSRKVQNEETIKEKVLGSLKEFPSRSSRARVQRP
jgi:hypothetical protein